METRKHLGPLIAAGTLLGIGMGGFVDGILFHQILQLHNMLSAELPPTNLANVEITMFWDGLFHAFTWTMTALGIGLLWRAGQKPNVPWATLPFLGSLWLGWGIFNLVEGVIDHHILNVHHVVERPDHLAWDICFLASGLVFMSVGVALIQSYKGKSRRHYSGHSKVA